ncbi:MAG: bacterial regulatory s, gntR family protein [Herminiimonas sp.]|jgi:DNA-binding GntR family transcriptional regulator|nr:bacterial regulatory s, gntR family protein [Herminiimonas sp.]
MAREKNLIRGPEAIAARVEEVRERVRNMIHDGQLQPGERINEQALAQELQIGRATAREALRSLEQAGLVRIIPNRGAEVCKLSLEDALHLYDIRASFAHTSGRLIALRITADDERLLSSLLEQMDEAANERDPAKYHSLNATFHEVLMQTTKNPRLVALNHAVEDELKLYLRKGVFTLAQIRVSQVEHRKILSAIMSGQPELAAEAFERHILTGKQRMLDTLGGESRQSYPNESEEAIRA